MIGELILFFIIFIGLFIVEKFILAYLRFIGLYVIVKEKQTFVYTFFGKVIGEISEPGIHCLWLKLGWKGLFVNLFGKRYKVDMRLDQEYLRSLSVNSEEGAPMGVGVWYEMFITNASDYLFKNSDPKGSLATNVGNSTVRSLSNLPLDKLMMDRHTMSKTVRSEVSEKSQKWGYNIGSCYIRKVHFRDEHMVKQIESKVVNRLRQVTSAINQDGQNQVSIIHETAEKLAAIEFAKAATIRPKIIGEALQEVSRDEDVATALFEILETEEIINNNIMIETIPVKTEVMEELLTSK